MKIFGKSLFEQGTSLYLYDFAQHGLLRGTSNMNYGDYTLAYVPITTNGVVSSGVESAPGKKETTEKKEELSPKEVYQLKMLNTDKLQIICDPEYVSDNVALLRDKLGLLPPEGRPPKSRRWRNAAPQPYNVAQSGAQMYGKQEMKSMITRLLNRLRYNLYGEAFNEWPYTTSELIAAMLKEHAHLDANRVGDTVPDLPREAVREIKRYRELCQKLCGQLPVFYLVIVKAKKEDTVRRRDPILLAQSPFGFFWQILGAWDEEVVFLEEL